MPLSTEAAAVQVQPAPQAAAYCCTTTPIIVFEVGGCASSHFHTHCLRGGESSDSMENDILVWFCAFPPLKHWCQYCC